MIYEESTNSLVPIEFLVYITSMILIDRNY